MRIRLFLFLLTLFGCGMQGTASASDSDADETIEIQFNDVSAAELGARADALWNHVAIFEYVRNNYDFIAYQGARSGSINTFLGGRGNDVDLAATLIAMLRRVYIPARYVVGTVRVPSEEAMNWLQVKNVDLAAAILKDHGIQGVVLSADKRTLDFEHVWVEAMVPYESYRGSGADADTDCRLLPSVCHWVALDPSYKQYASRAAGLDPYATVAFNYDAYYKALKDNSPIRDKNPLKIYEDQISGWLAANGATRGRTLDDIADFQGIVPRQDGLLPASLPYATVGSQRRYNSAADHDLAVSAGTEAKKWMKNVTVQARKLDGTVLASASVNVVDASTKRFTFMYDTVNTWRQVFRLDGIEVGSAVVFDSAVTFNTPIVLTVSMDGPPGTGGETDHVISAEYDAVLGGAYYIATGGEASNWSQVHRAARQLLDANRQYPVYFDATEAGCDMSSKRGCTPYLNAALTLRLIDSGEAMDALTGALLHVAGSQFYAQLREKLGRLDALNRTKTPVAGFIGVVSSTFGAIEYIDATAYSVLPGGLLIDMKGLRLLGSWRIDQPDQHSDATFELFGHVMSSLEHEVWQQLTGYDAISTVRGIQMALANGGQSVNPKKNATSDTLPGLYSSFGYSSTAPAGFVKREYALFGKNYLAWDYSGGDPDASFVAFRTNTYGLPPADPRRLWWMLGATDGVADLFAQYDALETDLQTFQATEGQWKTNVALSSTVSNYQTTDVVSASVHSPAGFSVASYARTGANSYNYVINETAQHADGTYPITLYIKLAGPSNEATFNYAGLAGASMVSATVNSPAGFAVKSFSKTVSADVLPLVLKETAPHTPGVYTIAVTLYWTSNSQLFSATVHPAVEVVGGRWVLVDGTVPIGHIDTSDNRELTCNDQSHVGAPSVLLGRLQTCFNDAVAYNDLANYLTAFEPSGQFVFRATPIAVDAWPTSSVLRMRDDLYLAPLDQYWKEYVVPSRLARGSNYRFAVGIQKTHNGDDDSLERTVFEISNQHGIEAGGGYVDGVEVITPSTSIAVPGSGVIVPVPTFDNATLTQQHTVAEANNDRIKTPSSADPVSTVTGNNYHDETDFVIKGRAGLDYAFTRTYNSASSARALDIGLGHGWWHSYAMRLRANDYGRCPDCTNAQAPENGNGQVASITYTDERGGDHTWLVNESSHAVSAPQGEFDNLTLDSPAVGQHTLTFRNGVKYVFETPGGSLKTAPGTVARLKQIADPWGNELNVTYDTHGRLHTVADNLGVSGRTGITFTYHIDGRIKDVSDWTGRLWRFSYDGSGNLKSMTNPVLQVLGYTYDAPRHLLTHITRPLTRGGRLVQTRFSYYENGRTFQQTDSFEAGDTLDYDLFRKTTRITGPRGGVRDYEYDSAGRLLQLIEADGGRHNFTSSTDGLRDSKTDPLGYPTRYSYRADKSFGGASDTFGNVTREQDALNQTVDTTYGPFDQIASVKDKRGNVIATSFHGNSGSCAASGKPAGQTLSSLGGATNVKLRSYCWNSDGTLASLTEYLSPTDAGKTRVSTYSYDAAHLNVESVTVSSWDGATTTTGYTWDSLGRKKTETLPRRTSPSNAAAVNLTTAYDYDELDRLIMTTDARGSEAINRYDANGQLWRVTHRYKRNDGSFDTRNVVTRTFDAADRVKTETDAVGGVTAYSYDEAGNVITVTDAEKHTVEYQYDAMNRRTRATDANGRTVRTDYDQAGRAIAVTNGAGETTATAYDALGRPLSVTDAQGFITEFRYDANGNLTCLIDANANAGLQPKNADGCTVSTQYDELNRAVLTRDALDGVTRIAYDLPGNPVERIDAEGRRYTWAYDGLGRLVSETDFAGALTRYQRDQAGNAWQVTNRLNEVTHATFDLLNRPTRIDYLKDGSSETFAYDAAGKLSSAANGALAYTFEYDPLNRLTEKLDSRGRSLAFSYDAAGNLLTKTTYQGSTTRYTYDGAGTLVAISNPDYLTVNYQYDAAGRLLSRVMSSGARSLYGYDDGGRLASLAHQDGVGATVTEQAYSRDRVGNITAITATAGPVTGTTHYTLDALYRLTQVDAPDAANDEAFSYDRLGNRLIHTRGSATVGAAGAGISSKYFLYTAATQTGSVSGYTPAYNHRLKEIRIGSATGAIDSSFAFDQEGRMTGQTGGNPRTLTWDAKSRLKSLNGETYAYDPSDHRVGRSGGPLGTLDYYLEGEHLESVERLGTLTERYFRGSTVDELVAGYVEQGGKQVPYFFQHDHLMGVVAQTKPNGGTQATMAYRPFGEPLAETGTPVGRQRYTGREADGNGCYYYRARYYCPGLGIFLSEDPLKFKAGPNFYAYVGNNPVNANDPTGLWSVSLEAYLGIGGGVNVAYRDGTLEVTGRLGTGIGAGLQIEPTGSPSRQAENSGSGYIARTFTSVGAEAGIGPTGIGGTGTWRSGNAVTTPVGGDYFEVSGTTYSLTNEVSKPYSGLRLSGAVGIEIGSYTNWGSGSHVNNNVPAAASGAVSSLNQSLSFSQLSTPGAFGGFLLYPNKPNTSYSVKPYKK